MTKKSEAAKRPSRHARSGAAEGRLIPLDDLDERIIAAMRLDGRTSNRDLAMIVGVNEATARSRMRRLEESETIRIVAIRDLRAMGFEHISAVGVQVKGRAVLDVAQDLAAIAQVLTVNITIGAHDIELQVVARDVDEMAHLLTVVLPKIKGIARLESSLALNVLKYESHWTPLK